MQDDELTLLSKLYQEVWV